MQNTPLPTLWDILIYHAFSRDDFSRWQWLQKLAVECLCLIVQMKVLLLRSSKIIRWLYSRKPRGKTEKGQGDTRGEKQEHSMYIDVNRTWMRLLWYDDYKSETGKCIILNKIKKVTLKFVSSRHAQEVRGRWSPCLHPCPSVKPERVIVIYSG